MAIVGVYVVPFTYSVEIATLKFQFFWKNSKALLKIHFLLLIHNFNSQERKQRKRIPNRL